MLSLSLRCASRFVGGSVVGVRVFEKNGGINTRTSTVMRVGKLGTGTGSRGTRPAIGFAIRFQEVVGKDVVI